MTHPGCSPGLETAAPLPALRAPTPRSYIQQVGARACRCEFRDSERSLLNRLFWRSGLASAYADMGAERLDKQVLLYRLVLIGEIWETMRYNCSRSNCNCTSLVFPVPGWPSLCEGWALGLANFLSARLLSISEDGRPEPAGACSSQLWWERVPGWFGAAAAGRCSWAQRGRT